MLLQTTDKPVSGNFLLAKNEKILVVELKDSGHYYYAPTDFAFLLREFENFIKEI